MATSSVVTKPKTPPFVRTYAAYLPKAETKAEGSAKASDSVRVEAHDHLAKDFKLPTEGFHTAEGLQAPGGLNKPATDLVRQAEVLKTQVGAGRHTLQYVATGAGAIGLAVACAGHPWAGVAVAAVGLLVGFGLQAFLRRRALNKSGANNVTGAQFKEAFEAMLKEKGGVVNDPALKTACKMYDFLTRNFWDDFKHDLVQPAKRAVAGSYGLLKSGLGKVFGSGKNNNAGETKSFLGGVKSSTEAESEAKDKAA